MVNTMSILGKTYENDKDLVDEAMHLYIPSRTNLNINCFEDILPDKYIDMYMKSGVTHYKITGRDNPDEEFISALTNYILTLKISYEKFN